MKITGYATVWGVVVHLDHPTKKRPFVFQRGCFQTAIERHLAAGTAPLMFLNHFDHKEMGVWESLVEDEIGLRVEGRLPTKTTTALVEAGKMPNGLCLNGFSLVRGQFHEKGNLRVVTDAVPLNEISIVECPHNPLCRATYVQGAG
jgi:HK97 family phage prohead protease